MIYVIDKCFNYALQHNRVLVIGPPDTWIDGELSQYFFFDHPQIFKGHLKDFQQKERGRNLTIFPPGLTRNLVVRSAYSVRDNCYKMFDQRNNLTLNSMSFDVAYNEDVVVYCNCYGGVSETAIFHMKLAEHVRETYFRRLHDISLEDKEYVSVHVRNTDRQCSLAQFMDQNKKILDSAPTIFLATDDVHTIALFKKKYAAKLKHFAKITENTGKNMHYYYDKTKLSNKELVTDALVDLLLLASGKQYIFSTIESNFSLLAKHLFENEPLLTRILYST